MLKKTVTYTDFEGVEVKEDLYFNLTQTEAAKFAMALPEDVKNTVGDGQNVDVNAASAEILSKMGGQGIFEFIEKLVLMSYGKKREDNKGFIKSPAMREEFEQSLAYDAFLMELLSNDAAAAEFVNGVLPASLAEKAKEITDKAE